MYPTVEKEASAIMEAVRKWNHLLSRQHFTLIPDQRSVSFMLGNHKRSKIKNNKGQSWRMELVEFCYIIQYRLGSSNVVVDSFTRAHCMAVTTILDDIHTHLYHLGVTRLLHFVKSKSLTYSTEGVKCVSFNCRIYAELKPNFYKSKNNTLMKSMRPVEQISINFKGPLL